MPDGTCEYVLDPERPETWGGEEGDECQLKENRLSENGKWNCPRNAVKEDELCIFHLPTDDKDDSTVLAELANDLDTGPTSDEFPREHQLIGARFGEFSIPSEIQNTRHPINLSHSAFEGRVEFTHIDVPEPIYFKGAKFKRKADFAGTTFEKSANFQHTIFREQVDFERVTFENRTIHKRTVAPDRRAEPTAPSGVSNISAVFNDVSFNGQAIFSHAGFESLADFQDAVFESSVTFYDSRFGGEARFDWATFHGSARFVSATFIGKVRFKQISAQSQFLFNFESLLDESTADSPLWLDNDFTESSITDFDRLKSEISDNDDTAATLRRKADFKNAAISEADFLKVEFPTGTRFERADLTDARLENAVIQKSNLEGAKLSRANLYNADLRGSRLSGAILGDVKIDDNTQFLGRAFDEEDGNSSIRDTVSELLTKPYCVYDPNYKEDNPSEDMDRAKSVYRALEELAGKAARPQLQSTCFVRRQDLQREQYWAGIDDADNLLEWLINTGRWSRAKVAEAILLYGESPWRILGVSTGIMLLFGILYSITGGITVTTQPATHAFDLPQLISISVPQSVSILLLNLYFSVVTFTTLGYGDIQPSSPATQTLAGVESLLGAALIALLVFVLGRRAAR